MKKEKNIFGFNQGGLVDSVPAMLTPGEFVVTKDAVEKVGVDTLKGLNASVGATNEPTLMEGTTDSSLGIMSLKFLGRSQWLDIEGSPKTSILAFDTPIGELKTWDWVYLYLMTKLVL